MSDQDRQDKRRPFGSRQPGFYKAGAGSGQRGFSPDKPSARFTKPAPKGPVGETEPETGKDAGSSEVRRFARAPQRSNFQKDTRPGRPLDANRPQRSFSKPVSRFHEPRQPQQSHDRPAAHPEKLYGRPSPNTDNQPVSPSTRQFGRPAPAPVQPRSPQPTGQYGRPAPAPVHPRSPQPTGQYGRPAPAPVQPRSPQPTGQYGRPAPAPVQPRSPQPTGQYGRPAPAPVQPRSPQPTGQYGRPAPASDQLQSLPSAGRFDRQAPASGFKREAIEGSRHPSNNLRPVRPSDHPFRTEGRAAPQFRSQQPQNFVKPASPPKSETILSQDARQAALLVLNRVLNEGAYASLSLDEIFQSMHLSQQDKRLTAVIVYKTVEDLLKIDYALDQFLQDAEALNDP